MGEINSVPCRVKSSKSMIYGLKTVAQNLQTLVPSMPMLRGHVECCRIPNLMHGLVRDNWQYSAPVTARCEGSKSYVSRTAIRGKCQAVFTLCPFNAHTPVLRVKSTSSTFASRQFIDDGERHLWQVVSNKSVHSESVDTRICTVARAANHHTIGGRTGCRTSQEGGVGGFSSAVQ